MKFHICFIVLMLFVLVGCGSNISSEKEDRGFDFGAQGGTRYVLRIPMEQFVYDITPSYNDLEFDRIFKQFDSHAFKDAETFFRAFCDTMTNSDYDIKKYFRLGNSDVFNRAAEASDIPHVLEEEYDLAMDQSLEILKKRFAQREDAFNAYINDQGLIAMEFKKSSNKKEIRTELLRHDNLQFMETYSLKEMYETISNFEKEYVRLHHPDSIKKISAITSGSETENSEELFREPEPEMVEKLRQFPILTRLSLNVHNDRKGYYDFATDALIGRATVEDTSAINKLLNDTLFYSFFPNTCHFAWGEPSTPEDWALSQDTEVIGLYLLRSPSHYKRINSFDIQSASVNTSEFTDEPIVRIEFKKNSKEKWSKLTEANVQKHLAILFNGEVISCAIVLERMDSGSADITANFTMKEAEELTQKINSGGLIYPLKIISEESK